ncbi:hypothetical protein [Candidatus Tisiphia endosymbiont of Nemotelus uliginosus]
MIEPNHNKLTIVQQCKLLDIAGQPITINLLVLVNKISRLWQ